MTTVRVEAGATPYDVLIGPFQSAGERLQALGGGQAVLVSEPRVFELHGASIGDVVRPSATILIPEGEAAKTWAELERLLAHFAEVGVDRGTPIVAFGGGSVGDLAGLAASLFKRGCPVVHAPTTLLAQADSAVGGKTAIDAFGEKNLIGSFHQPALVVADPAFLDTLPGAQLRSGYAEVVKYGLIDDPAFFAWCESNGAGMLAGHRDLRAEAIGVAVSAKARLVCGDVEDRLGRRALLNLGHSFAHAIESEAGLGRISHGYAVAVGIMLAFRFSCELGVCPAADVRQVDTHLARSGLPTRLADVGVRGDRLVDWMIRDKKNVRGALTLILVRGIGAAFVERNVDPRQLAAYLSTAV